MSKIESKTITSVIRLPDCDSGSQHNIVRLYNRYIDAKKIDKEKYFRREELIIINPKNESFIIRSAMGAHGMRINRTTIALDYDGVDVLGISFKSDVELIVRRATTIEIIKWYLSHQDKSVRLSWMMNIAGTIFGILGIAIGVVSLI